MDLSKLLNLPGLNDKNFVTGFLLPVFLAGLALAWIFPHAPGLEPLRSLPGDSLGNAAYLALGIWLGAFFLQSINEFIYQIFEGYLPPASWLFLPKVLHRRRLRTLQSRYDELLKEWQQAVDDGRDFTQEKQAEVSRVRLEMVSRYPGRAEEVLPTRFGNAIRAFEVYPRDVYGVDAVAVMLRLEGVMPKKFMARIEVARSQVNMYVNVAFLALIVCLAGLVHLFDPENGVTPWRLSPRTGTSIILSLTVFFVSYHLATSRVFVWGRLVNSAFDLYLPKLAKQMGYTLPPNVSEQRKFWTELSRVILYHTPMSQDRWIHQSNGTVQKGPR